MICVEGGGSAHKWAVFLGQGGAFARFNITSTSALDIDSTNTWAIGAWQHVAIVEGANNDHRLFFNGIKFSSGASRTPSGVNATKIASNAFNSTAVIPEIDMAWVTIWNVALDDYTVIYRLARWADPCVIRPDNLVACYPLGISDPELNLVFPFSDQSMIGVSRPQLSVIEDPITRRKDHRDLLRRLNAVTGGSSITPSAGGAALGGVAGRLDSGVFVPTEINI